MKALSYPYQSITADGEMQAFMKSQRLQTFPPHSADDFSRQIRSELETWKEVARAARIEAIQ